MAAMPAVMVGNDPLTEKRVTGHFLPESTLNKDLQDERSKFQQPCTLSVLNKKFKPGPKSELVALQARDYAQKKYGSEHEYADLTKLHLQFDQAQAQNLAYHVIVYFVKLFCVTNPYVKMRMLLANVGNWPQLLGFPPLFVSRYWHLMVDTEKKESIKHPILQGEENRGSKWERWVYEPAVSTYENSSMESILARTPKPTFDFTPPAEKLPKTATELDKSSALFTAAYLKANFIYHLWDKKDPRGGRHPGHSNTHGHPIKRQMRVEQDDGKIQWWKLQNTCGTKKEVPNKEFTSTEQEILAFCPAFVPPPDVSKMLLNEVSRNAIAKHVAHMDVPKLSSSTADQKPVLSAEENTAAVQKQMQKAIELRRAAQQQAADGHGLPGGVHVPRRMTMDMMDEIRENMKIARKRKADKETDASAAGGGSAGTGGSAGQGSGWGGRPSSGGGSAAGGGPAPGGPL